MADADTTPPPRQDRPPRDPLRGDVLRGLALWAVLAGLVGIGGVLARTRYGWWYRFDLDSELTIAAFVAAAALVLAGASSLWAASRGVAGPPLAVVGVLLVAMSVDELVQIHERFEARTGIDWQTLYLPIMVAAGVAFLVVAHRCRHRPWFLVAWLAGGALWAMAQGLEMLQWQGDVQRSRYTQMMIVEEVAELSGTGCFLVATWAAARRPASGVTTPGRSTSRAGRSRRTRPR